jgi:serine/threonine-protein kinase
MKTELKTGSFLGKYRIEKLIGTGAMAEVYQAYHPDLNRNVAIKRLHAFLADQTDMLDRFRREAQNIAALKHRNIVQVYDFDTIDSMYYMVMEYIDGDVLKKVMKTHQLKQEPFPLGEALRISRDVGIALAYAHEHNVVHRDVKPANIMRDKDGRIVLADFGLARFLAGPQYTSAGTIVGTPSYM